MNRAMQKKACTKCGEVKDLDEFWRCIARPDGREAQCAECRLKKRNPERSKENGRSRARVVTPVEKSAPPMNKKCIVPGCITKIASAHLMKGWDTCMRHDGWKKEARERGITLVELARRGGPEC